MSRNPEFLFGTEPQPTPDFCVNCGHPFHGLPCKWQQFKPALVHRCGCPSSISEDSHG